MQGRTWINIDINTAEKIKKKYLLENGAPRKKTKAHMRNEELNFPHATFNCLMTTPSLRHKTNRLTCRLKVLFELFY